MDIDDDDILTVKELSSDAIVDINTSGSSKHANYELMVNFISLKDYFLTANHDSKELKNY
jgi:hypothetical protein